MNTKTKLFAAFVAVLFLPISAHADREADARKIAEAWFTRSSIETIVDTYRGELFYEIKMSSLNRGTLMGDEATGLFVDLMSAELIDLMISAAHENMAQIYLETYSDETLSSAAEFFSTPEGIEFASKYTDGVYSHQGALMGAGASLAAEARQNAAESIVQGKRQVSSSTEAAEELRTYSLQFADGP